MKERQENPTHLMEAFCGSGAFSQHSRSPVLVLPGLCIDRFPLLYSSNFLDVFDDRPAMLNLCVIFGFGFLEVLGDSTGIRGSRVAGIEYLRVGDVLCILKRIDFQ